ncbi:PilZ domain-containing protein [Sediminicurvatus halobius]|uniref:PilZ domain-containing protein n=1 Tax=Sediminicurvatus halobius TaxID=2182432 RepID=A0A2U2N5L9_9GAMM|nr:PilZ domain-containing protein [Spiribacter halobius]PWG64274.1 hypothetical protein DEM34_05145 [Spiribacter halobius]UEX79388.1 flagellar brake protein [Spiribacter halobius]
MSTNQQPSQGTEGDTPTGFLLAAGSRLRLQRAGSTKKATAEVVGYGGRGVHAYIILRSGHGEDDSALTALDLRADDTLLVRCLYDGIIYGFRTTITRLLTEPDYLLFVLYPHTVEQVSVRQYPRLPCALPCDIDLAGAAQQALMLDISAAGCGLAGQVASKDEAPAAGSPITVQLPLPGTQPPVSLTGELCRIGVEASRWEGGVRFDAEQEALFEQLRRYLSLRARH